MLRISAAKTLLHLTVKMRDIMEGILGPAYSI